MREADLLRLSPRHQALIKKQAHASEAVKKPRAPKPAAFGEEFDSQLELDFAWELERQRLAGLICEWRYHPLRFRIAKNVTYTPDFLTVASEILPHTGDLTFIEVKGSWKQKGGRDSRTRLQVAAYLYQWFGWVGVTRVDGVWQCEVIHAADAEILAETETAGK